MDIRAWILNTLRATVCVLLTTADLQVLQHAASHLCHNTVDWWRRRAASRHGLDRVAGVVQAESSW